MNHRRSLFFDQIFSNLFFEIKVEEDLDGKFPHPIPADSAENLGAFLASPDGERYITALKDIQARLAAWCRHNGLNPSPCDHLTQYTTYTGVNVDANRKRIGLYREGIPGLYNMLRLLAKGTIPINYCKDVIGNLLKDFAVCEPGAHSHIYTANLALKSYSNRTLEFMAMRKKVAEQFLLEKIKKYRVSSDWEIHYVNAVLLHCKNELVIDINNDEYINDIQNNREKRITFESLCLDFQAAFPREFTIETVIDKILSQHGLSLEGFRLKLHRDFGAQDASEDMERNLGYYGLEPPAERHFYNINELIQINEGQPGNNTYQIRWNAEYVMYASIYNRLCRSGLITPSQYDTVSIRLTNDDTDMIYLAGRTLRLAYVHAPAQLDGDNPDKPLIPYIVEVISSNNNKLTEFVKFLQSGRLTDNQMLEIIEGCLKYLASKEFAALVSQAAIPPSQIAAERFSGICKILAACNLPLLFYKLLAKAPYEEKLIEQVKSKLLSFSQHPAAFAAVLSVLPAQHYSDFIKQLTEDEFKRALGNEDAYACLLSLIGTENYNALFKALGRKTWQQVISGPKTLGRILCIIPPDRYRALIQTIGPDIFRRVDIFVENAQKMSVVFSQLPPQRFAAFYNSLTPPTVSALFGKPQQYHDYFSGIEYHKYPAFIAAIGIETFISHNDPAAFSQLLSLLSSHAYEPLFSAIGIDAIVRICGGIDRLEEVYTGLPEDKRAAFLQAIGPYVNYPFLETIDAQTYFINLLPTVEDSKKIIALVQPEYWPLLVPDLKALIQLLNSISVDLYPAYLGAIGDAHLKTLLASPGNISEILHPQTGLPLAKAKELLALLGLNIITPAIPGVLEFTEVLKGTATDIYSTFITHLNNEVSWSILKNGDNIFYILHSLPNPEAVAGFIRAISPQAWTTILSSVERFANAVSLLNKANYRVMTSVMEPATLLSHMRDANNFRLIVEQAPVADRAEFIAALPDNVITDMCPDAARLGEYLAVMSRNLYVALQAHFKPETMYALLKGENSLTILARKLPAEDLTQFLLCISKRVLQPYLKQDARTLARIIEEFAPIDYQKLLFESLDITTLLSFESFTAIVNQLQRNKSGSTGAFLKITAPVVMRNCNDALQALSGHRGRQHKSLYDYVSETPAQHRTAFLKCMHKEPLRSYIRNADANGARSNQMLYDLLTLIPEKAERITFLRFIGAQTLQEALLQPDYLTHYLQLLPLDDRQTCLELSGSDKLYKMIPSLEHLVSILGILPYMPDGRNKYPAQCCLFDLLGGQHICAIFGYQEKKLTDKMVAKIAPYGNNTNIYYPLLMALKRGYCHIRSTMPKEHDHFWGDLGLFNAQDKNTKLSYAEILEEAIRTHNHDDFFARINKNSKAHFDEKLYSALRHGDLSDITNAFMNHYVKHQKEFNHAARMAHQ